MMSKAVRIQISSLSLHLGARIQGSFYRHLSNSWIKKCLQTPAAHPSVGHTASKCSLTTCTCCGLGELKGCMKRTTLPSFHLKKQGTQTRLKHFMCVLPPYMRQSSCRGHAQVHGMCLSQRAFTIFFSSPQSPQNNESRTSYMTAKQFFEISTRKMASRQSSLLWNSLLPKSAGYKQRC
jgi:hypothetical protein